MLGKAVAWLINRGWTDAPRYFLSWEGDTYGKNKAFPVFDLSTPTHHHNKRGTEYVLIGIGKMQAENWGDLLKASNTSRYVPTVDMREVAIYQDVNDGSLWVRPREDFEDPKRFTSLA